MHEPVRIAVIEVDHNPRYPYKPPIPLTVVVNPVIEALDDELVEINEGCLSVPDLRGNVERHVNVRVRYLDRDGVAHDEVKRGLTAGTFQHEVDHLDGVLFVDRVRDPRTLTHVGAVRAVPPRRVHRPHHRVRRRASVREPILMYWCELAWLGGDAADAGVTIEVDGDRIAAVSAASPRPPGAHRSPASRLPGLANAHSHAFHRALRGTHAQRAPGSFWTWREQMYALAERLDPDRYHALARATFAEMVLAGITLGRRVPLPAPRSRWTAVRRSER